MKSYDYELKSPNLRKKIDLHDYKDDLVCSVFYFMGVKPRVYKRFFRIVYPTVPLHGHIRAIGKRFAAFSPLGKRVKQYFYNKHKKTGKVERSGQLFIKKK